VDWKGYLLDIDLTDFPVGARVLDLGCGGGAQLLELAARGCIPTGADIRPLVTPGFVCAAAEALPFREGSFDGVVCKVALPYMDERRTRAEIARVLRVGGTCRLSGHGLGYYVRYLLCGQLRERIYAARTIANTWLYRLTHRRLVGDTLYQSPRQWPVDALSRFLGLPVFIYATLERHRGAARASSLRSAAVDTLTNTAPRQ
jgi:ubiquinone/menaquinone biosynthesis C-methylase UbiE